MKVKRSIIRFSSWRVNLGEIQFKSAAFRFNRYNNPSAQVDRYMLPNFDETSTLTVSELNRRAKMLLETQLNQLRIEGELSNFSRPASGHWYFSLKDEKAQIRCAMFRNRNSLCRSIPKSGDKVIVRARVSLYEPRGDYQLIVDHLASDGAGALQEQFEILKKKLNAEGLFDPQLKQPLPLMPKRIGVISSNTGAAIHDILHVLNRRYPLAEIIVIPSAVQGNDAPNELIQALENAEKLGDIDTVIIGRGGGSIEDLAAFNNEDLARKIFSVNIPIISAVGHETDFSIADFVADVRAPTPSAAAELATPDQHALKARVIERTNQLVQAFVLIVNENKQSLRFLNSRLVHPGEKIAQWQQRCDISELHLERLFTESLNSHKHRLIALKHKVSAQSTLQHIQKNQTLVIQLASRLKTEVNKLQDSSKAALEKMMLALDIVSPLATLKRGYTLTYNQNGKLVSSVKDIKHEETIKITFSDGEVAATTHKK